MSNWLSRVVVAAILLPIVLGAVYLGGWYLFALVAIGAAIALHEYWLLGRALSPLAPAGYIGGALALLGAQLDGVGWMLGGALTTFALAFLLKAISEARAAATAAISSTVTGALWICGGLGFLILLRHFPTHGRLALYTVLLAVWAGDTFAYFGGRLIGRHRMAPTLSPGKTWEGFVVGSLVGVFVAFVALYQDRDTYLVIWQALVLGVVVVLVAVAGDLFESMLKRDMQVKDTGQLLGGHGGVLDRIDALLFASAAAFYLVLGFNYS